MAPLPDNNTACYFVDYSFAGQERTMQFRALPTVNEFDLAETVQDLLNALAPEMDPSWAVLGARYRAKGSLVTLPAVAPTTPTGRGPDIVEQWQYPRFLSFIGRGQTSGRRVRLYVYGLSLAQDPTYRFDPPLVGAMAAARGVLEAMTAIGMFLTIAEDVPLVYPYANLGFNAYWQKEQRG